MKHHPNIGRPARSPERGVRCPDLVALITFGDDATVRSRLVSAFDPDLALAVNKLDQVTPGYTNVAAGIRAGVDLLSQAPRGLRRRLWLLSDGAANRPIFGTAKAIEAQVRRARDAWVNINAVGFGDPSQFDERALRAIAAGTHNGRYMEATTAEALSSAFRGAAGRRGGGFSKGEATAFVIDASGSMFAERMGGRPRIEVVKSAMWGLLTLKQRVWS
jgi:Mg-chelatase subunit ChlD